MALVQQAPSAEEVEMVRLLEEMKAEQACLLRESKKALDDIKPRRRWAVIEWFYSWYK